MMENTYPYKYKYEAHLHTAETSLCGKVPAAEQVKRYHDAGYAGICVTDHLHGGYLDELDHHHWTDWDLFIERWLTGYRLAKRAGDALGLDVILGAELRFPQNERDYLVYGIDEAWLHNHPYMFSTSAEEFFSQCGNDVLVIHAHPYRYNDEVLYGSVHGLEIVNCNPRHDSRNELALQLAMKHPGLIRTVGSDCHRKNDACLSAVLSGQRITDSFGYRTLMLEGNFSLWCPSGEDIIKRSEESVHV